jgi:hypothetical protein
MMSTPDHPHRFAAERINKRVQLFADSAQRAVARLTIISPKILHRNCRLKIKLRRPIKG